MSPRPRRGEQPTDLRERILATAWKQIAELGAPALSLRAIARELSITAPAIYNYYPDRDALVTALIVDAYSAFGDAQLRALNSVPVGEHAGRLRALGLMYRQWAVDFPERYHLIFGTPIAGYNAPMDITGPAAARGLNVLVQVLADAEADGKLRAPSVPMNAALKEMFQLAKEQRGPVNEEIYYQAVTIWTAVHGLVFVEISQQFPPFITNPAELYTRALDELIHQAMIISETSYAY